MGKNQRKHKKFIRQSIYLAISIAIFVGILFYARNLEQLSTHFFVKFRKADGTVTQDFKLEIADTEAERAKGLMYRKEMPESEGMIFVYPKASRQAFWMKNTYIPLDMIFIDQSMEIVGIVKNVQPLTTEPRGVDKESLYVIELNAGTVDKYGITDKSVVVSDGNIPKAKD